MAKNNTLDCFICFQAANTSSPLQTEPSDLWTHRRHRRSPGCKSTGETELHQTRVHHLGKKKTKAQGAHTPARMLYILYARPGNTAVSAPPCLYTRSIPGPPPSALILDCPRETRSPTPPTPPAGEGWSGRSRRKGNKVTYATLHGEGKEGGSISFLLLLPPSHLWIRRRRPGEEERRRRRRNGEPLP